MKAIKALGFDTPSEIQQQAIPQLLRGDRDFIGLAQTGTGKTAAFGLPLLQQIDPEQAHTQALILAPTRELGQQIAQQMELFSKHISGIRMLAVYGGASIQTQLRTLRKPVHLLIATPGRLIDLMERGAVQLDQLRFVILDEADEMLNFGFKEDIDRILRDSPDSKRTWLFSATLSADLKHIVDSFMDDPFEVRLSRSNEANVNIEHRYCRVMPRNQTEALARFLDAEPDMRGIVFCRTKIDTQRLADELGARGYRSDALHGDLSQPQRDRVTDKFRRHELQVLVATDVAARGLDVQDLTHVFHFNIPDDFAYYTHRSGRTARAGKKGISLALISPREEFKLKQLSQQLKVQFEHMLVPDAKDIMRSRIQNWTQNILAKDVGKRKNGRMLEEVMEQLSDLSRDELVHRILLHEFDQMQAHSHTDLNAYPDKTPPRHMKGGGKKFKSGKGHHHRPERGGDKSFRKRFHKKR